MMQWKRWYRGWRYWSWLCRSTGDSRLAAEWEALRAAWWTRRLYRGAERPQ